VGCLKTVGLGTAEDLGALIRPRRIFGKNTPAQFALRGLAEPCRQRLKGREQQEFAFYAVDEWRQLFHSCSPVGSRVQFGPALEPLLEAIELPEANKLKERPSFGVIETNAWRVRLMNRKTSEP
jgi:hypothetical protein